jgi:hypothetical protein
MKLKDVVKDEAEILALELSVLAGTMLQCLASETGNCIKRHGLAGAFLRDYPNEKAPASLYAVEEALIWLEREMYIGRDPIDPDMIFVTRQGRLSLDQKMDKAGDLTRVKKQSGISRTEKANNPRSAQKKHR